MYLYVRYLSSKLVHIALFVVLNFVKLCNYCNFHSEVHVNNKFVTNLDLLLFVQELYSKNPVVSSIHHNRY